MSTFALVLHPEILLTSRPVTDDDFLGHSLPFARQVHAALATTLHGYPSLPLRMADIHAFAQALNELPWVPDLICVFAGVDSHRDDCGGGITDWTNDDFQTLTQLVLDTARSADCPVLSVQGGGYKLPVTIAATAAHVAVLAEYR